MIFCLFVVITFKIYSLNFQVPNTVLVIKSTIMYIRAPDLLIIYLVTLLFFIFYIVVDFVIHWNETAMGLHVFPIPIPPPTSLSTRSLYVFPVHQVVTLIVWSLYPITNISIFPPPPAPADHHSTLFLSVSLFIDSTCKWEHRVLAFLCLILLSVISFIHVVSKDRLSFFFMTG